MSATFKRKLARKIKAAPVKRIAQIILPKFDNDGKTLAWQHEQYQKAFCHCFGGYTAYDVRGGWMNDNGRVFNDESVSFHIAMHDDESSDPVSGDVVKLLQLARAAAGELRQECIFVALPSGEIRFITQEG